MFGWKLCECTTWCTWYEILRSKHYNWLTLDLCTLQFEYDKFGPVFRFQIGLLGFNFAISINPPWESEQSIALNKDCAEAENSPYFYKMVKVKNKKYKKGLRKKNITPDNTMLD